MKVERPVKSGAITGAAWLSSARVVRCWVKSRNERNHYPLLPLLPGLLGEKHSKETARDNREEGGDDAKSACPSDVLGRTRATIAVTTRRNGVIRSKSLKAASVRIEVCNPTS